MSNLRLDYCYFLVVPWVMGLASFAGFGIPLPIDLTLRHTGMMWMLTWAAGIMLFVFFRGGRKVTFPYLCWLPFYALALLQLGRSPMAGYNIQFFVQITVFLILGMVVSFTVRSVKEVAPWNWMLLINTLVIGVVCGYFMLGPGQAVQGQVKGNYQGFAERPAGASLIVIGAFYIAQSRAMPIRATLMWLLCFGISIASGGRMATAIVLIIWLVHPTLTSVLTRFALATVLVLAALVAFNTPIIQDRFFNESNGFAGKGGVDDVAAGKFDSAGRFDAWPKILKRAQQEPVWGHGLAMSHPYTYKVWPPMDKPHNEYLRIFFEMGYVGLVALAIALLGTWWNLRQILQASNGENWVASAAYMGFIGFVLLAVVDNPLIYGNNFMHPLFALIGAANGIMAGDNERQPQHESAEVAAQTPEPSNEPGIPALVTLR